MSFSKFLFGNFGMLTTVSKLCKMHLFGGLLLASFSPYPQGQVLTTVGRVVAMDIVSSLLIDITALTWFYTCTYTPSGAFFLGFLTKSNGFHGPNLDSKVGVTTQSSM